MSEAGKSTLKEQSMARLIIRRFFRHRLAGFAIGALAILILLAVFASQAGASVGAPGGDGDPDIPQVTLDPIRIQHPHPTIVCRSDDAARTLPEMPSMARGQGRVVTERVPVSEGRSWPSWLLWLRSWMFR